ncbi:MAG: hypothetical protein AAF298_08095 [Cyanobacteria bacterium P01_A01_bin.40]
MATKTLSKPINLQTIALKLLNNEGIVSQIPELGMVITAQRLASKIPSLKVLGNMPLIQLNKSNAGTNYLVPTLYQHQEKCVLTLADINASITDAFEVIEWKAGDVNQAIIKSKQHDLTLTAAIAFDNYMLDDIRSQHDNRLEGKGLDTLIAYWLKPVPQIEIPLRNLPIGVQLTIVDDRDQRTKKFNTQLVDLTDSDEKLYKNVITNADLRNLIADGCKQFKINSVQPANVENRKAKSKKDKTRTIHKVLVEPIDGTDFSDF